MDFTFSDEQEALRSSARRFLDERYPLDRVAAMADGDGFPREEWAGLADLGWTGIAVSEQAGGAGLGLEEELILTEELGRALYPGPFLSTVTMALPLLIAGHSDEASGVVGGDLIATVGWASHDGRIDAEAPPKVDWEGGTLNATRRFVPHTGVSDLIVIVGSTAQGPGAWAVHRDDPGVSWREVPVVDGTRRLGEVVLEKASASALDIRDERFMDGWRDRSLVALAAESVGVAARVLEIAVDHARTRQQFGRPIGAFQAVSHQLAQAFLEIETARSLVYWAGWAVAGQEADAPVAAALAKARATQAAVGSCERAIQVLGGAGFTWDHPLHRYYKRALANWELMGTASELRARAAAGILG
jgi:alkylation response protein AidB-like acyl-CoA dehydrogenase